MTSVLCTRAAATVALLHSSCGTTKLSQTWHDPADAPVLVTRVLVIAIQLEVVTGTTSTLIPASLAFASGPGLSGPPAVPSPGGACRGRPT
jgi:hypothetical protein